MFVFITMKLSELIWGFKISDDTTGGVYVIYALSTLELLAELVMINVGKITSIPGLLTEKLSSTNDAKVRH